MNVDLSHWGPLTVLVVVVATIVVGAGAAVTIVQPSTLSFEQFLGDLTKLGAALGIGAGVGRGIHLAGRAPPVRTRPRR